MPIDLSNFFIFESNACTVRHDNGFNKMINLVISFNYEANILFILEAWCDLNSFFCSLFNHLQK